MESPALTLVLAFAPGAMHAMGMPIHAEFLAFPENFCKPKPAPAGKS